MLKIGKEMCDAAAAAFPNQNIALPNRRFGFTYPDLAVAFTTLCRDIEIMCTERFAGIQPRPYAQIYLQRNTVDATGRATGRSLTQITPDLLTEIIKYMIRAARCAVAAGGLLRGRPGLQMSPPATWRHDKLPAGAGGPKWPCGPTVTGMCHAGSARYSTDHIPPSLRCGRKTRPTRLLRDD